MLATALLALLPLVAASPVARQDGVNAESLKVLAQRQNKYFGTAYQSFYLADERFEPILDGEFDQYTPENEMKWEVIQAERGVFNWTGADLVSSFIPYLIALMIDHGPS
jgi:endo-1,4-beta-xylanase